MPHGSSSMWCTHWWHIASAQQAILRSFGIPFFSYRDMVWPLLHAPPPTLLRFWNGLSHPDEVAHALVAAGTLRALSGLCACDALSVEQPHRHSFETSYYDDYCKGDNYEMHALSLGSLGADLEHVGPGWVRSGTGWAVNSTQSTERVAAPGLSNITFQWRGSGQQKLVVTQGRSHKHTGHVDVYVSDRYLGTLDAHWDDLYTLPDSSTFTLPSGTSLSKRTPVTARKPANAAVRKGSTRLHKITLSFRMESNALFELHDLAVSTVC